ncbi:hypothetical protein [Streptomyces sp. NPDC021096]|uniref:hypothetical protein n=1 Tax=Streptomyces sp. NPDC021096 TaxID=3154792 RepID=UPI0033C67322
MTAPPFKPSTVFQHTRFIPRVARAHVEAQLDRLFADAAEYTQKAADDEVVLLVAGSLARGEAAVEQRTDGWSLASDLDFVAIVPDHHPGEALAEGLLEQLSALAPQVQTTCFTVRQPHAARVRSHFGADLWLAAERPVAGELPPGALARPAAGAREDLELIVHQAANYLLVADQTGGPAPSRCARKLLLETLRALTPPGPDGNTRYTTVLDDPTGWSSVLHASQVRALVAGRETGRPFDWPYDRAHAVFLRLLAQFLNPDSDGTASDGVPADLARLADATADVLTGFQVTVLAYFGILHSTAPADYAHVLLDAWARLDANGLEHAREHRAGVAQLAVTEAAEHRPHAMTVLREAMAALRLDYYRDLGARNFGQADDNGYARMRLRRALRVSGDGGNLAAWPQWVQRLPLAEVALPRAQGRLVVAGLGQTVLWAFPEGGSVPAHRHGPQLGVVLAGCVHLARDGVVRSVKPGESFEIRDQQQHAATVAPGTLVVEVFAEPNRHRPKGLPR